MDQGRPAPGAVEYRGPVRYWRLNYGTGELVETGAGAPEMPGGIKYNNTCMWANAASIFSWPLDACEAIYDTGMLPIEVCPGPNNEVLFNEIQFGYVTFAPPGDVDIELRFFDELGGDCVGPALPPQPVPRILLNLNTSNGYNLPGDTSGTGAAHFVTIDFSSVPLNLSLLAMGDGIANNGNDKFTVMFRHHNPASVVGGMGGPILGGEPSTATFGACTYDPMMTTCGADNLVGNCGTGLGAVDSFWVNVDGDPADSTVNSSLQCLSSLNYTGCFPGQYPLTPFRSLWLKLTQLPTSLDPVVYCTPKTGNLAGCVPSIGWCGIPDAAADNGFTISCTSVTNSTTGVLLWGNAAGGWGPSAAPWLGGTRCLTNANMFMFPNTTPIQATNGTFGPPVDCTGTMSVDFNAFNFSGPMLLPGDTVWAQWMFTDPLHMTPFGLSDALRFDM